jgi:methylaspartate ammonia-lyase
MIQIADVIAIPASGGFFFDDQVAIKAGAARDGLTYPGMPVTPGFDRIRQPAAAVSVLLVLSDGHVAHGDCVSVQYSAVAGREPTLDPVALAGVIESRVAPVLRGRDVTAFRPAAALIAELEATVDGFGTAAAYGLSQALLDAAARRAGTTMADAVQDEWGLEGPLARLPVFAQTGEERAANVDKMILKRVDSLPHGLINEPSLVGPDGGTLVAYVRWVADRVRQLRAEESYSPILHFDVYGLLGAAAGGDLSRVADVLVAMERAAEPFALRVEHPLDAGSRDGQIRELARLRGVIAERGARVQIVADEWANTVDDIRAFNRAGAADVVQIKTPDLGAVHNVVDAVIDCRAHGVVAHVGGSCCETDRSAQVCVHLALGSHADQMLAKPGMGVDEGLLIVRNEMERALRLSELPAGRAPLEEQEIA